MSVAFSTAELLARALSRSRKIGRHWIACCPAHDDREPSLSISETDDGKLLVHCHAGCGQERVIAALRSSGLWTQNGSESFRRKTPGGAPSKELNENADSTRRALEVLHATIPANGTLVTTYFAERGIHIPMPSTIRFRAELRHPTGDKWPAMVALVTRGIDDQPLAIHRTFLARDGRGKAPVEPSKDDAGALPWRGCAPRSGE